MIIRPLLHGAKHAASQLLGATGVFDYRLERLLGDGPTWIIAMYHRVIADRSLDPFRLGMCVHRDRFIEQITWLRSKFELMHLDEVLDRLDRGEPLPPRIASVTFDDGYLDNLEIAAPILARIGVPTTLFVVTGGIETGTPFWWDRVIEAFASTDVKWFDASEVGLSRPRGRRRLSWYSRTLLLESSLDQLWSMAPGPAASVVAQIERHLGSVCRSPTAKRLTPPQVRQLAKAGIRIGAHSVAHHNLTLVHGQELVSELTAPKRYLEALCQRPTTTFAYPGGYSSVAIAEAARAAGFQLAVATRSGINRDVPDRFNLKRIGMPMGPIMDLKRCLSNAFPRPLKPTVS
jgi:peptidoglycan/xylan/chitin deacetylase (PgdA/CDA1 family)